MLSALVLGATGLVGRHLTQQLLDSPDYQSVTIMIRAALPRGMFCDPQLKLRVHIIDFAELADYEGCFGVDHVYCCLGTTLKQAGSKQAFRYVDFQLVHVAAQLARAQRAHSFVWVSSVGANKRSRHLYLRVKGELESAIMTMPQLNHAAAVRPSLLIGERKERRFAEDLAKHLAALCWFVFVGPWKKYQPVHAADVARQMIKLQLPVIRPAVVPTNAAT